MAAVGGNITRASHGNFVQVVPPLGVGIRLFGQGAFWCLHRIEPCLRMVRVSWQFTDHDSQCIFWNKTFMVNPFFFSILSFWLRSWISKKIDDAGPSSRVAIFRLTCFLPTCIHVQLRCLPGGGLQSRNVFCLRLRYLPRLRATAFLTQTPSKIIGHLNLVVAIKWKVKMWSHMSADASEMYPKIHRNAPRRGASLPKLPFLDIVFSNHHIS